MQAHQGTVYRQRTIEVYNRNRGHYFLGEGHEDIGSKLLAFLLLFRLFRLYSRLDHAREKTQGLPI